MQDDQAGPRRAMVLFAHGARDPDWAKPFEELRRAVIAGSPGVIAELAYLDLMKPSLEEAVTSLAARGVTHITIVPVFFGQGSHLKRDLPAIVDKLRIAHPALTIDITAAIGEQPAVIAAIAACVTSLAKS